jgi:hypothetical protein
MPTLAEEVLLLAHDEVRGRFVEAPALTMDTALAGAVLMELAMLNRIDTDPDRLILVDPTPTGEPVLDGILARIAAEPIPCGTAEWVSRLREEAPAIRAAALARLVERGILREEKGRFLWVFGTRRYPLVDGTEQREVKHRIAHLLLSDDIPDPRDAMLVGLADACGLLERVFSEEELRRSRGRIKQIVQLDLIGRAVGSTIEDLRLAVAQAMAFAH